MASTSFGEARTVASLFPISHSDREVRGALAKLALRLARFAPALPDDDDPALRPRWDAASCASDSSVVEGWSDPRLLAALRVLRVDDVADPAPLISRLAQLESDDALHALEWARASVARGSLDSARALSLLEPLSQHASADVRACFVDALAEPWLALADRTRFYRRALADSDVDVVRRAILDVEVEPERLRALREHDELRTEVALALSRVGDATDLAASLSVREAVLAHHRAGRFPRPEHVAVLVDQYSNDDAWAPAELARVLYTCRTELLDELASIGADDPRWRRLAELLAHVEGQSSEGRHAGELLALRLRESEDPDVVAALLRAAADCPVFDDEDTLVAHLEALPQPSIHALRRHGSERSLPPVLAVLRDPVAFGAARREVLDWCWMIAADRLALIAEHGAESWTDAQLARAAPLHAAVIERARSSARTSPPIVALHVLGSVADVDPSMLSEPFRAAVRAEVVVHGARRPRDPHAPTAAEQALMRIERRLVDAGRRTTRHCDPEPGSLVRTLALEWLRDAGEDSRELCLALGVLNRHPIVASQLRWVHPLWRHSDPDVQRAAAEVLLRCRHSDGLALSLSMLATTDDIRTQRQGLRAIEHFESRWAEAEALRGLESPNMNIKKAAASALRAVGSSRCVSAVLRWLGAYDNPGLRTELLAVLDRVAGDVANALLLGAYQHAERMHRPNLLEALQGRLSPNQLVAYSHRGDTSLADVAHGGALSLASGTWADVAARLHRESPSKATTPSAIDLLERDGFSPERARAALDESSPRLSAAIRSRLPEWARWAVDAPESHASLAARRVLEASHDVSPAQALALARRASSVLDVRLAIRVLARVASHGEQWRYRAIELARSLEMPAHQRWHALRQLGAVMTRGELEAALDTAGAHGAFRELLADALPTAWSEVMMLAPDERRSRALTLWECGAPSTSRRYHYAEYRGPRVTLERVLGGRAPLPADPATLQRLADELMEWPTGEAERRRALSLVRHLPLHRLRRFLDEWFEDALQGSEEALAVLRHVPREELLAHPRFAKDAAELAAKSVVRDLRLARIMWEHRVGPVELEAPDAEPEPIDPLDEVEGADALLVYARKARGREASRAVGRLGKLGALAHLRRALDHKDSNPRTVALRWLRRLLTRDEYLALTLALLGEERDPHLRRSLLRGVARRGHTNAYPQIVALVLDSDPRIAREAIEAVHRIGEAIRPHVEHAIAHERPDRARKLRELLS